MSRLGLPHLLDPDGLPLFTLRDINRLPTLNKERLYAQLLPEPIYSRFGIDRGDFRGTRGDRLVRFICPAGLGLLRIEARERGCNPDCAFFVEIADTPYGQIELSFCLISDPSAPRFDVDRDSLGRDNCFGTVRRNIPEEIRAMEAGLSPNQVRRGMKLFSVFLHQLERFVDALGIGTILAEPLSYGSAIRYESYGFDYIAGKQLMLWINREFQPGGILHRRLDGSTPFRRPGMERSVCGRSWAIHDGILGHPWDGIKIYKVPGVNAGINTFPEQEIRL